MLQGMPDFSDLAALNAWLEQRCLELWRQTPHGKQPGTIADVWAEEQSALMPLPVAFDGFIELSKRVSPTCLISFERNRYSVPASFANRPVSLRIYPDRLVVAAEGSILCEHPRVIERSHHLPPRTIYDWRHYLAVVQRKPGALRNGAPFLELPPAFRQLQDHMLRKLGGRIAFSDFSTGKRTVSVSLSCRLARMGRRIVSGTRAVFATSAAGISSASSP